MEELLLPYDYPVEALPPDPMARKIIDEVLPLGVKAVDGLITVGKGQRIGIFAGSGVGKSTLLGMFAVFAALFLINAGLSDVATITTERFMPSSPRSRSTNSLTSLPRSPINAITLISDKPA